MTATVLAQSKTYLALQPTIIATITYFKILIDMLKRRGKDHFQSLPILRLAQIISIPTGKTVISQDSATKDFSVLFKFNPLSKSVTRASRYPDTFAIK